MVGGGGEEGKRIKIVYISMTSSLALFWSFVLRVIGDILWTSCFESYGPKDTR